MPLFGKGKKKPAAGTSGLCDGWGIRAPVEPTGVPLKGIPFCDMRLFSLQVHDSSVHVKEIMEWTAKKVSLFARLYGV